MGMTKGRLKFLPVVGIISLILIFASCSSKEPSKEEVALFDLAAKAQTANDFKQAIEIYNKIIEDFPSSPRLDKAIFMIGFIKYDNLHDTANAALAFRQVVDKYPQSDLFDDAKFMLETIKSGQDPYTALQNKINR
jgi:outer membrane protein assembly factor BamD (BamD/ComL family)